MEKFITANDTALRISDSGKGNPAVVLLHGYLESLDIWEDFSKSLTAAGVRAIAIDIPGHGISQVKGEVHTMDFLADVLAGVLDNLGVERCVPVGHSMGGYVVCTFAARYPERLSGLVLFHSTPNPDSETKKIDRQREIELVWAGKKELLASAFAPKGFALENRRRLSQDIAALEESAALTDDEGVVALLNGMMERPDRNETLRKLTVPELFIFGKEDEYIPADTAEKVIEAQPQAQVAWLEHSGHMGFLEEPEASARILLDFLKGV